MTERKVTRASVIRTGRPDLPPPIFETVWRAKWTCDGATTLQEMADKLRAAAEELEEMAKAGLELESPVGDDYAFITCEDAEIAKVWGMYEREMDDDELFGDD